MINLFKKKTQEGVDADTPIFDKEFIIKMRALANRMIVTTTDINQLKLLHKGLIPQLKTLKDKCDLMRDFQELREMPQFPKVFKDDEDNQKFKDLIEEYEGLKETCDLLEKRLKELGE